MRCGAVPGSSAASPSRRRPHPPRPLYTCAAHRESAPVGPRPSFREPKTTQRRSTVPAATESPPAALKGNNGCALRRRAVRRAYDQRSRCQPTVLIGTVTCEANQQRTTSEHAGCRANRPQRNRIAPTDRSKGIRWLRRSAECCSGAQRRRMCGTAAVLHGMAALGWFALLLQIAAARSDRIIGSDKT